jgi:erythromycin esterase-like protein
LDESIKRIKRQSVPVAYRAMFLEEVSSWNLRDRHMAETLDALVTHLDRNGSRAKVAVGS